MRHGLTPRPPFLSPLVKTGIQALVHPLRHTMHPIIVRAALRVVVRSPINRIRQPVADPAELGRVLPADRGLE